MHIPIRPTRKRQLRWTLRGTPGRQTRSACRDEVRSLSGWVDGAGCPWADFIPVALSHREEVLHAMPSMDWDDYLRDEAGKYRQLAEKAETVFDKQEFLDLAVVCEEVANSIEDRLTGG